jgi:hypothetical protein
MQDLGARWDVRCRNRNELRAKKKKGIIRSVTYPVLSVLTVRAELGRGGASTRMGVRAGRALTGLSFSVASGHMSPHLFSMTLIVADHATRTHI